MLLPVSVVSRLAPTPSGFLHLGNAVNFTLTWLLTRRAGGTLHLRIDDLDRARFRPAYLDNIFRTLEWLRLDYDAGPAGPDDFERNYSQLLYLPTYEAALQAARAAHPQAFYACRCSRTDLARTATAPNGRYPGTCQQLALPLSTPETAWRARVPAATQIRFTDVQQGPLAVPLAEELGDFVVRKKDGVAAYQVASVVDDVRLGVNLIVRGLDLLPSTAAQLWLAAQLPGMASFQQAQFLHHGLLLDTAGQKLSKSTQTGQQRGILAEAGSPGVVYAAAARLLGLPQTAEESLGSLLQALNDSSGI
ncbi:glutamate--tRNA ligase family protein [Hymenobacter psychrotolerans]|uniref:Glutamyl-tRNA synthetase n=1 Tax=Hymenobacter psychrotolerans DSM 18569 TaxID=1121959 RepID=A0A1M7DMN1_9BACT|nr:glutamate--tRNA ligase family protein [Hymenobacter psychrotolerans]SHL80766.1 glutamyl-tRNA synthetase [Hymenobacter psychrotolerans DSM 18569]